MQALLGQFSGPNWGRLNSQIPTHTNPVTFHSSQNLWTSIDYLMLSSDYLMLSSVPN